MHVAATSSGTTKVLYSLNFLKFRKVHTIEQVEDNHIYSMHINTSRHSSNAQNSMQSMSMNALSSPLLPTLGRKNHDATCRQERKKERKKRNRSKKQRKRNHNTKANVRN